MATTASDPAAGEEQLLDVGIDLGQRVITLSGEVDLATAHLFVNATEQISPGGDITVDLGAVRFIGAAGLNAVIGITNGQREQACKLLLVGVTARTKRLFDLSGLASLIEADPGSADR